MNVGCVHFHSVKTVLNCRSMLRKFSFIFLMFVLQISIVMGLKLSTVAFAEGSELTECTLKAKWNDKNRSFGIDISHHQRKVNFQALRCLGGRFVFIKATEGITYIDPLLQTNLEGAKKERLVRGVYHFFRADYDGVEQAQHFLKTVPELQTDERLIPMLDLEVSWLTRGSHTRREILTKVRAWLDEVERVTGKVPVLYVFSKYWRTFSGAQDFSKYPLFTATRNHRPEVQKPWDHWTFWQYRISRIPEVAKTPIDFDYFNGDIDALPRFSNDFASP